MHVNLGDTATGNVNGNSGKGEAFTITPNVYNYETRPRKNETSSLWEKIQKILIKKKNLQKIKK